ncbi:hypothetical protein [Vibrio cholerae]|uniref:hypothetical protein n=1 Tax=Vibrio cholerae TaxID=666 RepID=UPI0011DB2657|nr:hypothetical protein [Vibrio cholerae]TXX49225.1 hypothetical protein FXF14_08400 [Vibrio cholerae]
MKTLILKTAASQKSFTYDDYEITNSDAGLASVKFTRNEEYVVIYLSNSTGNPIEKIEHRYAFSFKAIDKLETALYNSVQINNREFYVGQTGAALKEYVNSSYMPLSKAAKRVEKDVIASVVKSRNAAKQQEPVTKSSSTLTRQQQIEAFVNKNKPQSKDVVAEQVFKTIQKQKLQQKLDTAEVSKSGNMVIEGKEVLLTKAADIQLLSVLSEIKKNFKLENLNLNQQGALAEFITSLSGVGCAVTLTKMANDFIAKLSTIK